MKYKMQDIYIKVKKRGIIWNIQKSIYCRLVKKYVSRIHMAKHLGNVYAASQNGKGSCGGDACAKAGCSSAACDGAACGGNGCITNGSVGGACAVSVCYAAYH